MAEKTPQIQDKFVLRMPDGLRERIKAKADENNRSMNAEILHGLERVYPAPTDVMHLRSDAIREALDLYEKATDLGERLRLQMLVTSMATSGGNITPEVYEELNLLRLKSKGSVF